MNKIFILIIALLFAVSDSQAWGFWSKKHKKKKVAPKTMVSAAIRYSGCYGKCPEYMIEIVNDGTVFYTGMRYAKDSGVYKKRIEYSESKRILKLFEQYRVDTCRDKYPMMISDIPVMSFMIKYKESTKKIANATFGPAFFKEIAAEMEIAGKKTDEGWEKIIIPVKQQLKQPAKQPVKKR